MKNLKRALSMLLILIFVLQAFAGCSPKKTDEEIYLTKGEFFALFVYEHNMTSTKYSADEIQNCQDGSVEADIIVEWGYLTEKQAKRNLKKIVTKEIVVLTCANATFGLKEGNVSSIKDADLLDNPQVIADAYASGFFELDKGYFDGATKMSYAACEEIIDNARQYTADFHFEPNTEKLETAEDVAVYKKEDYVEGDIVVQFHEESQSNNQLDMEYSSNTMLLEANSQNTWKPTLLNNAPKEEKLDYALFSQKGTNQDVQTTLVANGNYLGYQNVRSFSAQIRATVFEQKLGMPKENETVVMEKLDLMLTTHNQPQELSIIGILKSYEKKNGIYYCLFEYPEFEPAVKKQNVKEANKNGIDIKSFVKEKTSYMGWNFEFDVTGSTIDIKAKKDFTVYETGRKQEWQNSKKTVTATAGFSMTDFNIDMWNLKSFATKKGEGWVKVTCDTNMDFSLETSLRYTPDSNRNGKFPSNWENSRWTNSDAKGAERIKVASFSPSVAGVVGAKINIYLLIHVDGKVSFESTVDGGGFQISCNNGNIRRERLGKKTDSLSAYINLKAELGIEAELKIFCFIKVINYDVNLTFDAQAMVNLYYKDVLEKDGVCADEEGLTEYLAEDKDFSYCAGILIDVSLTGELKESGVKWILDTVADGYSMNFEILIWSGGFHVEDGKFIDECTRGNDLVSKIQESKNDDVELDVYKITLDEGKSDLVYLKAIPCETMDLTDSKNAITVKSKDKSVATASYNKKNKVIIIEAVGEGSTEITVKAKRTKLFWKKEATRSISITVNRSRNDETQEINYIIPFIEDRRKSIYL